MFRRTSWGEIILFGRRTIFSTFPEFEQKVFRFWRESFDRMVTTTFYMCRSTIWEKIIFLTENSYFLCSFFGIWVTNLWFFWRKIFDNVVKSALSAARESFLMKINSDKKIVTTSYLASGKLFQIFGDKVTAVMSKLFCTCSDEHFEEN